jgi:transcription elongation GreA/GreB family factor
MPAAPDLSSQIAAGELDAIQDAWLGRLAEAPHDVEFFVATGKAMIAAGHGDDAVLLLEMADEHLRQAGSWAARLALLRAVGDQLHDDALALHKEILRTLRGRYEGNDLFTRLVEKVGLQRAPDDIPKTWEKVSRLGELMALAPGTVVLMEGKGAGRVAEVNLQLDAFRVALPGLGTLSVGFAAAKKMLRPLPADHFLHRKLEDPAGLQALKEEQPAELVGTVLRSYDEPLTGNDLRQALQGIVAESEWTGFWNRAKKSPHIVALPGSRQRYRWAESAGAAVADLEERFAGAGLRQRLDLLKSHGERDPALRAAMLATLGEQLATLHGQDPPAAFEAALALQRAGGTPAVSPEAVLAASDDPVKLLTALADRTLREEGYRRLREARRDWQGIFERALLREDEARVLDLLADRLAECGNGVLERLLGELLTQPRKSPGGFTWLAERAAREEAWLQRSPLRLFQQILTAAGDDAFGPLRKRLGKLAESGGTLPRLLPFLDAAQATQAEEALGKGASLEEYQREALRNAIHLRFPELRQGAEQPLYATPEAIAAKREELRLLLEEEIPANRRAIEEARALGDLRENFEYKSARQRHEYLAARAAGLHRDLGRARPLDAAKVDASAVRVGTRLRLTGPAGEERWYTLLGPWESQPEQNVLSNESDLAQAMLDKRVGDSLPIEGKPFRIAEILPYR